MKAKRDMTYSEAIEKVMLENGYLAPLKLIYREIWRYKDQSKVIGKTPNCTIQARVQRDPRFTRIGLGVYALTEFLAKLPQETAPRTGKQQRERLHATAQGMLIEIGNDRAEVANTYTHDRKWVFQNKTLGSLATLRDVPPFTYPEIIRNSVRFLDVIWFNERGFPLKVFEVEESTDFRDAFVKFAEIQDFQVMFYCISGEDRRAKFLTERGKRAFESIRDRCEFRTYEQVTNDYQTVLREIYL